MQTIDEIISQSPVPYVVIDDGVEIEVDHSSYRYQEIKDTKVLMADIYENSIGLQVLKVVTLANKNVKRVDDLTQVEKEQLNNVVDEVVSVVIVHKQTNQYAGQEVSVRDIRALAFATVKSYQEAHPSEEVSTKDFLVIRVNFDTRNILIQAIE